MKPKSALTPKSEERLRELYRKNYLGLILLPPEAIADEFPELVRNLPTRHSQPSAPTEDPQTNLSDPTEGETK